MVFINYTNHPSAGWSGEQKEAAQKYGDIVDVPFPQVPPEWSEEQVCRAAREEAEKLLAMKPAAVLCQGDFTFAYAVIQLLKKKKIPVLAACSRRDVKEWQEQGKSMKSSVFRFVRFRQY